MDKIIKIQSEIGTLSKDKTNPFFKSKYFDINQIIEQLSPLLKKYGVTVMQPLTNINGKPAIKTYIVSDGVAIIDTDMPLPDLSDPQKLGGAITYLRRYSLQSVFLLQAEDDDGNKASEKDILTDKHEKWNTVISYLANGGDISAVEKKYSYSDATKKRMENAHEEVKLA